MASQIYKRGPTAPQMNITPLIDVTFLLIIFFMLVNNVVDRQTVEMIIPDLDAPGTRPLQDSERRIVVNVAPVPGSLNNRESNPLLYNGEAAFVMVGSEEFLMDDMAGVTESLRDSVERDPQIQVLVRADAALYYEQVEPVMMAITNAGVRKVDLVALIENRNPSHADSTNAGGP